MINLGIFEDQMNVLRSQFRAATPYPHIVLDGFFDDDAADEIHEAFPAPDNSFIFRKHLHSNKLTSEDGKSFPDPIKAAFNELHSPSFLGFLTRLTGVWDLHPDPELFGGGVHVSLRGGFLDIHADFTEHPKLKMRR